MCDKSCEYQEPHPINAVINLTDQCNFRCPYCFVGHNPRRTTYEIVEQTIKYLLSNLQYHPEGEMPNLWFFGGEPMLEYNSIIVPIVEAYRDKVAFGITTNGSLLTEDVVDFFADNNIPVLLSIDGDEEVQNKQRPFANGAPSFDAVVKNIPYYLLRNPDAIFRATLTKFSIPRMNRIYDFAQHMGFKRITFVINEGEEYEESDLQEMIGQYNSMAIKIIGGSGLWLDELTKGHDWDNMPTDSIMRCGYCTTSMGVTVEGKIVPCQELSSLDVATIGDVFNGIDPERHRKFIEFATQPTQIDEPLDPRTKRIVFNGICPKHQYFDNSFTVSKGKLYQLIAIAQMYGHFSSLTSFTPSAELRGFSFQ